MAKRAAKKVPRHGAGRNAKRGTRAFCRICRGPHTKRQHWSHKKGVRTTATRRTVSYSPRKYGKAPAGYRPAFDRVARPQAGRGRTGRSLSAKNRGRAALPAAPVRRSKQLAAKSAATSRKKGGTKRKGLTAGQKRYRARARAEKRKLREDIGFAAFAGAARKGKARRRELEAAEARGAAHTAAAAVKASKTERRQARRAGAKTSSLPRTPWSDGTRAAAKRKGGRKGGRKGRRTSHGAGQPRTPWSR